MSIKYNTFCESYEPEKRHQIFFPIFNVECGSVISCNKFVDMLPSIMEVRGSVSLTYDSSLKSCNTLLFPNATYDFPVYSYAAASLSTLPNFDYLSGGFSISLFVKTPGLADSDMPILELLGPQTGQVCASVRAGCTNTCVQFEVFENCSCRGVMTYKESINTYIHVWTHFAVTYVPGTLKLYQDGVQVGVAKQATIDQLYKV
jgi:hypothetical protein